MRRESDVSKRENAKPVLPMVSDTDKIVMLYGKPHKAVMVGRREMYEEVEWEQIPKHRYAELKNMVK